MKAEHIEVLVEEPSMESFLAGLLPRLLGERATFAIHVHRGKQDLIAKMAGRLRGYASWLPNNCRVAVIVDRDDDDCVVLKQSLEQAVRDAGLRTRSTGEQLHWQVVTRLAIEELEAWYFGDWDSVCAEFPRVQSNVPQQAQYRDPDAIAGGTWEALERILQRAGYFSGGLRKIEIARQLGQRLNTNANNSRSFAAFHSALLEAVA